MVCEIIPIDVPMRLEVYLNQYGGESGFGYEELLDQGRLVESLGFDSVAVGERNFYEDGFPDT
jgi:hypothetical protein